MSLGLQHDRLAYLQGLAPKIFNFEDTFEVSIFDELTKSLYHSQGPENEFAKKVLEDFLQNERSWCRVDSILEFSQSDESRFYALLILENLVKSRWKLLPPEQRTGIRDYIVQQIIQVGSQLNAYETRRLYINKLTCILVEILKFEWPKRWPEFIDEIVQSSKISESIGLINMKIMRLLSEEIFVFSSCQMNHIKTKYLREALCTQLPPFFSHIYQILKDSTNVVLIIETLKTLAGFMPYIPNNYIFDTSVIEILIERLLKEPMFSNDTLSCLSEIMQVDTTNHQKTKLPIYTRVLEKIKLILPHEFDFNLAYTKGTDVQQVFLRMISMFFSQSIRGYQRLFGPTFDVPPLIDGLWYMISCTGIDDTEIFKICVEFWKTFTSSIRGDKSRQESRPDAAVKRYLDAIEPVFSRLRHLMITHMRRPEEVIIYVNEHGDVVRQFMRDTDSINLYHTCKDVLNNLTWLNPDEMRFIILERLDSEMNAPVFSWHNLNCLGWAVGSISGAMSVEMERDFLVRVLKNLLALCDEKKGKDNKAIIASNIMYVVQLYPRFLRPYYRFLKTVLNKLFEFMSETHEGVQDMATDAFLSIAKSCKFQLSKPQQDESRSYIEEIVPTLSHACALLDINQLQTVYEALGHIISGVEENFAAQNLIIGCLSEQLTYWGQFTTEVEANPARIADAEGLQKICHFLKMANAMCRPARSNFVVLIDRIFLPAMKLYSIVNPMISQRISTYGPEASMYSDVKALRGFKRDFLNLLSSFLGNCSENLDSVKSKYIPTILTTVMADYASSLPEVKEPEVLTLATSCICCLKMRLLDNIINIFQYLFDSTLSMINKDYQEYPEHRINFFKLLEAIATHCFESLVIMNPSEFEFIMQSLFYAVSHTMPAVSSIGLTILITVFKQVVELPAKHKAFVEQFYRSYYVHILDRILLLATDGMHTTDLAEHSFLLSHILHLLDTQKVASCLTNDVVHFSSNHDFVKKHSCAFLKQQHEHLTEQQIVLFVDGMFCFHRNHDQFIQHIRDFLLMIKEHQGQDVDDLFTEELKKEMREASGIHNEFSSKLDFRDSRNLQDYHTLS